MGGKLIDPLMSRDIASTSSNEYEHDNIGT